MLALIDKAPALNQLVTGSSPVRVTLVTWAFAPVWVTLAQAAVLSGHDEKTLQWLIDDGDLDAGKAEDGSWLIEKQSLYDFQLTLWELAHWND